MEKLYKRLGVIGGMQIAMGVLTLAIGTLSIVHGGRLLSGRGKLHF